jgi:osmotically-inducible protein OsmY
VTLGGSVGNLVAKRAAEENARYTVGVRTVNNRLKVRPSDKALDETMANRVRHRLHDHPVADRSDITVALENGVGSPNGAPQYEPDIDRRTDSTTIGF